MMNKYTNRLTNAILIAIIAALSAGNLFAQKKSEDTADARKDAQKATAVLNEMMKKPDDFIPRELLQKANAIAVFPDVVKGAFIIGGGGGHGVVSVKNGGRWSEPAFFNIGGASFGAQIGVKKTDYIMLFMNDAALKDLMDEKLEFGGDLSFAAGPVGRTAGASTTTSLDTGVLTWSRSAGAFVGASLKGADLNSDNSKNRAVYGMTAGEIMANPGSVKSAGLPAEITGFTRAVASYAGSSR
jgi:lipid-binding SYLF domain-containing protein